MPIYLVIIFKIIFTGSSQMDVMQKVAISKNVDNVVIVQLPSTLSSQQTWVAKDRTFYTFNSTTSVADFLYTTNFSTAISDIEIYSSYKSTFTYLPPRVDIQFR